MKITKLYLAILWRNELAENAKTDNVITKKQASRKQK